MVREPERYPILQSLATRLASFRAPMSFFSFFVYEHVYGLFKTDETNR